MKSSGKELDQLFAFARQAPPDGPSETMPYGFATRVLSRVNEKRDDWLAQASKIVRWSIAGGVAVILAAAVYSFSDGDPQAFASMEFAVEHEFTKLVLQP